MNTFNAALYFTESIVILLTFLKIQYIEETIKNNDVALPVEIGIVERGTLFFFN